MKSVAQPAACTSIHSLSDSIERLMLDKRRQLVFNASVYEVTKSSANAVARNAWIRRELDGCAPTAFNAFRVNALLAATHCSPVARRTVECASAVYRSEIEWFTVGMGAAMAFDSTSSNVLELNGPLRTDIDGSRLVGVCFEATVPLDACVTSARSGTRTVTLDELVAASGTYESGAPLAAMYVPLLVVSGVYYEQYARANVAGDGSGTTTHTLRIEHAASLLLAGNQTDDAWQRAFDVYVRPACVPVARRYYIDVSPLESTQHTLSSKSFELEPGACVHNSVRACHALLGALQRFHCECTIMHRLNLERRADVNSINKARVYLFDALNLTSHKHPNISWRQLVSERGFGALAVNVARALRTLAHKSVANRFRDTWFVNSMCTALAFTMLDEPAARSEACVHRLVMQNPRLSNVIRVVSVRLEPDETHADYATQRVYRQALDFFDETWNDGVRSTLVFVVTIQHYSFGVDWHLLMPADTLHKRKLMWIHDGNVLLSFRHVCGRMPASKHAVEPLLPPRDEWPWLIRFMRGLLLKPDAATRTPDTQAEQTQRTESQAKIYEAVCLFVDDLPLSVRHYAATRPRCLDDWPCGGERVAVARSLEPKPVSYAAMLGLEADGSMAAAMWLTDASLWNSELRKRVNLVPLECTSTSRADDTHRDSVLVERYGLAPDTDQVDALIERRALAPCVVGMEQRARGINYVDVSVGYKHYDRLDHASQLLSLVPDAIESDDAVTEHILKVLGSRPDTATKMREYRADLRSARGHYKKRHAANVDYAVRQRGVTEDVAAQQTSGCLSCAQLANGAAQLATSSHARCPFADYAARRTTRATLALYLDAACGSIVGDIEDLVTPRFKFSDSEAFTRIADNLDARKTDAVGDTRVRRACVDYLLATRFQSATGHQYEHLSLSRPSDYTLLAMHIEHTQASGRQ